MKVSLCESILSEQQRHVPVEPVLALGWGHMAREQPLIKVFESSCPTAWEKLVCSLPVSWSPRDCKVA